MLPLAPFMFSVKVTGELTFRLCSAGMAPNDDDDDYLTEDEEESENDDVYMEAEEEDDDMSLNDADSDEENVAKHLSTGDKVLEVFLHLKL
ncbi:hypothetical protein TYRP_009603 [Tyrophagus putrescentiae]|nr:hypothetical protein TYRP_009603 [Tyrophagus putrescentiae]